MGSIPLFLNRYKMYDVHITSISNSLKRNEVSPVVLVALPGGPKLLVLTVLLFPGFSWVEFYNQMFILVSCPIHFEMD